MEGCHKGGLGLYQSLHREGGTLCEASACTLYAAAALQNDLEVKIATDDHGGIDVYICMLSVLVGGLMVGI